MKEEQELLRELTRQDGWRLLMAIKATYIIDKQKRISTMLRNDKKDGAVWNQGCIDGLTEFFEAVKTVLNRNPQPDKSEVDSSKSGRLSHV